MENQTMNKKLTLILSVLLATTIIPYCIGKVLLMIVLPTFKEVNIIPYVVTGWYFYQISYILYKVFKNIYEYITCYSEPSFN